MACSKCGQKDGKNPSSCPICKAAKGHHSRAKVFGVESTLTSVDIHNQVVNQKMRCYWCETTIENPREWIADHLVSLSKGGTNTINNIVISCPDCNTHKGTTDIYTWLRKIGRDPSELAWTLTYQHVYVQKNGYPKFGMRSDKAKRLKQKRVIDVQKEIAETQKLIDRIKYETLQINKRTRIKEEYAKQLMIQLEDTHEEVIQLSIQLRRKYINDPTKWGL